MTAEGDAFQPEAIDPRRCPICRRDNHCAAAEGRAACWCFARSISRDVLERIPPQARDKACICPDCAEEGDREEPSEAVGPG